MRFVRSPQADMLRDQAVREFKMRLNQEKMKKKFVLDNVKPNGKAESGNDAASGASGSARQSLTVIQNQRYKL
jgi:hypothetical protein